MTRAERDFSEGAPHVTEVGADGQTNLSARESILGDYREFGYAVFSLPPASADPTAALLRVAADLGLGAPFVPPLYRNRSDLYARTGVNLLTVAQAAGSQGDHPAFQSRGPIEFHTDGTLQDLGEIQTAFLLCLTPAAIGGDTTLFAASRAFTAMRAENPHLAGALLGALLNDGALSRHATIGDSPAFRSGPVFGVRNGEVLSRYSVTPRDKWATEEVEFLAEARRALEAHAAEGSPYCAQIRLEAGQGIILANDRVSHGRTAFEDSAAGSRRMLRALFAGRPGSGEC
jgi:hypothetical protein